MSRSRPFSYLVVSERVVSDDDVLTLVHLPKVTVGLSGKSGKAQPVAKKLSVSKETR